MDLMERIASGVLLLDGAMGTELHKLTLTAEDWGGHEGCNEFLVISAPDKVRAIHAAYYAAGSDAVETNTFGASPLVLAEYGLADRAEEINLAAARLAREAADAASSPEKPRYVFGSVGPGTRLPSLGQVPFRDLLASYSAQMRGLVRGGVDAILVETCQDLLQVKAAVHAARAAFAETGRELPIIVSITVETSGTMLLGSEVDAAAAVIGALGAAALGINCATGPDRMAPYVRRLAETFPGPLMVMPNAGMPENRAGKLVYTLQPADFAATVRDLMHGAHVAIAGGCCGTSPEFIQAMDTGGVRIAGGCCGTSPEFIKALSGATGDFASARGTATPGPALASLYKAMPLAQEPRPFIIGERANANGSKKFRELLLAGGRDGMVELAVAQESGGAHALDVCVAYAGRDEKADMVDLVSRLAVQARLPLVIDSTNPEVIEAALEHYGGRALINSINLEDGEAKMRRVLALAKAHGAAVIALTIDEEGMARAVERKIAIAKRIAKIAMEDYGLAAGDLLFDVLTFTLGSGDVESRDAGLNTLEAIRRVKAELPGCLTVLGLSNISFGLKPFPRQVLNSVFLHEAIEAGLDAAIVHAAGILPLARLDEGDRAAALALIRNEDPNALFAYLDRFADREAVAADAPPSADLPLDERIKQSVIRGMKSGLDGLLEEALAGRPALGIVNELLVPAMKVVGELFGSGEMQLPFVLRSAEVMRAAVDWLEPHMEKNDAAETRSLVLATVRGDVHDIGKNLVDIILSNNGFTVHNIGIQCELETMLAKAAAVKADAIGMSGLLVKSTQVMLENLEEMQRRGIHIPVLLGGAALTRPFVDEHCAAVYDGPVVYCPDAFAGLTAMQQLASGTLEQALAAERARHAGRRRPAAPPAEPVAETLVAAPDIPEPPFLGTKTETVIPLEEVFALLTEEVLFRGRWGYRRGKLTREAYAALVEDEVRPEFERLKREVLGRGLFAPRVAWGYYRCNADGDALVVFDPLRDHEIARLAFPRQRRAPHRAVPDFFLPVSSGKRDVIAFQAVTIGPLADQEAHRLYAENRYREYLLFHGLAVETSEALAEYWHRRIRQELGITAADGGGIGDFIVQHYRGSRYSFGYPACPDMAGNETVLKLVHAEKIGITLTESGQMVPEQTTAAFIAHHPQAKYFAVE